jgi:ferritin-like metal-binding protein YciE
MQLNNLQGLFEHQLKDLYSAETQLMSALPKMANAASHKSLRDAFQLHLEQTRHHVERLDKVCRELNMMPQGAVCEAMKGLIREGEEILQVQGDPDVKDAALIAAAQRVEHYEIAGYGTVVAYAKRLGHKGVAKTLGETLAEEEKTDKQLTKLAEGGMMSSGINKEADH